MSVSQKDFEQAADILRRERQFQPECVLTGSTQHYEAEGALLALNRIEDALCAWFQAENPRFDPARFRRASQP